MPRRILLFAAVAAAALGAGLGWAALSREADASFTPRVTNPWFPLKPGTRWVYTGVKDGRPDQDIVYVTSRVKVINGAPCVAVSDRLYEQGHLRERTTDYYSQDSKGTVWYFGEDTAELNAQGQVTSREGTWQAGRNGAKAGIFMPARLRVGASYRQEYLKGHAEDHFKIIGRFDRNGLLTKEWTPLEPGVIDHKMYVRGVGEVLEQTEKGGNERGELVSMTRR